MGYWKIVYKKIFMNDTVIIQHFVTLKKKNENEERIRLTICKIN